MAELEQQGVGIEIKHLYKIFGPNANAMLELVREQGIGKDELRDQHGHVLGLQDINISMAPGKIQVVMGLSGSGKSTLIRHINRLIEPTAGSVMVGDREITTLSPDELRKFRSEMTAMVFQKFALFPHYTVTENAMYGLDVRGVEKKRRLEQAMRWIERVGLKGYEDHYPNQLSGGMQQRVGLARALTNDAPILLMDEAFSALDPLIRNDMQTVLLELQEELAKTVVFISHDLDEALRLGDQITILRQGAIQQQGTGQQIVLKPANDYIRDFIRDVNRGRVVQARTVMREGATPVQGPSLGHRMIIEEAARELNAAEVEEGNVVDAQGHHLGVISRSDILSAMLPPTE
jgi:glycine betaine/proline transport system ATP-binding protein